MKKQTSDLLRAVVLGCALAVGTAFNAAAQDLKSVVATWEKSLDGRIGVVLRDTSSNWGIALRARERFPMSSTFKSLLCGAVLARVDAGNEDLGRRIRYARKDLVAYSPVTEKHLDKGLTVAELCQATITLSDNTAANLLLETIGGPAGLTGFLRETGNKTTRLDRWETDLNQAMPGDPRDTTTPADIMKTLERFLYGDVLKPGSSAQLRQWMIDDKVADTLIRPHVPEGWVIGDKTGAGGHGTRGITAFLETPEGVTYLVAIYLTENDADLALRNQVISEIARAMIAEIQAR